MKKKNIITIVLLILLIFWFLLSRNENFMYEFNKMKSWIFISLLYKVVPDPEYEFPEYTDAQLDEIFERVESYMWELPPIPDEKINNSTLLGIDSNNNWVRDDLEIWIVENFSRDKMVVESFFAYVRSNALNKVIQRDGLFTDELYQEDIAIRLKLSIYCSDNVLIVSNYWYDSIESYLLRKKFRKDINDTSIRKQNAKDFSRNMSGRVWKQVENNENICNDFFEETKTYKIY